MREEIQVAIKCFDDNINRMGGLAGASTSPYEYNMNVGLLNLARAIENIEDEHQKIKLATRAPVG